MAKVKDSKHHQVSGTAHKTKKFNCSALRWGKTATLFITYQNPSMMCITQPFGRCNCTASVPSVRNWKFFIFLNFPISRIRLELFPLFQQIFSAKILKYKHSNYRTFPSFPKTIFTIPNAGHDHAAVSRLCTNSWNPSHTTGLFQNHLEAEGRLFLISVIVRE